MRHAAILRAIVAVAAVLTLGSTVAAGVPPTGAAAASHPTRDHWCC